MARQDGLAIRLCYDIQWDAGSQLIIQTTENAWQELHTLIHCWDNPASATKPPVSPHAWSDKAVGAVFHLCRVNPGSDSKSRVRARYVRRSSAFCECEGCR